MLPNERVWLSDEDWADAQRRLPIACVDALPVRLSGKGANIQSVGLILRHTPAEGDRWCLVGGRILYRETLSEALDRHVRITLGDRVSWNSLTSEQPLKVIQYFPERTPGYGWDTRQHAVAMTFAIDLDGDPVPQGEALDFKWFAAAELDEVRFGFDQGTAVRACLTALVPTRVE